MFNVSDYIISMQDPVETGRTKINYLLTGDSSPFNMWSGTPDSLPYLSVYRIDNDNPNYIHFSTGSFSATSPLNLIFNGAGNSIVATASTIENLISGLGNSAKKTSYNTLIGSTNIINGTGDDFGNGFIHGIGNLINFPNLVISSSIISSKNSFINFGSNSTILNGNSSFIQNLSFGNTNYNFISGAYNKLWNVTPGFDLGNSFIGNGTGNTIQGNLFGNFFAGIVNGTNNLASVASNVPLASQKYNVVLFGSDLTAVSKNYSHFENLYINEVFLSSTAPTYGNDGTIGSFKLNLTEEYTFHEIVIDVTIQDISVYIKLPNPSIDLMFLSVAIILDGGNTSYVYFTSDTTSVPISQNISPSNLASKPGSNAVLTKNRCVTSVAPTTSVAYFFIWTKLLNKWVMYSSDNRTTATF